MAATNPSAEFRVTRLIYRLVSETPSDDFSRAEPLDGYLDGWEFRLEGGVISATPSQEFRSREAARADLEAHLRQWSQSAFLSDPRFQIRFDYERADVEAIDPPPNHVYVFPEAVLMTAAMGTPTIVIGHRTYPAPDPEFRRTPLTDLLTERLRALVEGRAELPAAAYQVLSALEHAFGGRKNCATALAIDPRVLATVGRLSTQFDPKIGRKAAGDPKLLTTNELAWLNAVSVRLVRRVGEHAAGGTLPQIVMADLPSIDQAAG